MSDQYRKKPIVINAFLFDGNVDAVIEWKKGFDDYDCTNCPMSPHIGHYLRIGTLEGEMIAAPGDWIIRGIQGEFYPCKPDIFEATYEPVNISPIDAERGI